MVVNETSVGISEIMQAISTLLPGKVSLLINIFKAAGVVIIVYFAVLIIQVFLRMKDRKRLKRIEEKLDILLKQNIHQTKKKN